MNIVIFCDISDNNDMVRCDLVKAHVRTRVAEKICAYAPEMSYKADYKIQGFFGRMRKMLYWENGNSHQASGPEEVNGNDFSYDGNEKSRRVQEKCGFTYYRTTKDVPVPLMNEVRIGNTNLLTKEQWIKSRRIISSRKR